MSHSPDINPANPNELQVAKAFAKTVAHEINSPLATTFMILDGLLEDPTLPNVHKNQLLLAADELTRVANFVNQTNQLRRVVMYNSPVGQALDLEASTKPEDPKTLP